MKTKQLFITLIYSTFFFACTTDDSILNNKKNDKTLESLNSSKSEFGNFEKEIFDRNNPYQSFNDGPSASGRDNVTTSECNYKGFIYIYYSNSSTTSVKLITIPNLDKIYSLRNDFISNDIYNPTINGCLLYKIPEIPSLKYNNRRKQYYETWDILSYSGKPRGGEDDIEL